MKTKLFFLGLALCLLNCQKKESTPNSASRSNDIVIGKVDSLYSEILEEPRNILIHLPESARNSIYTPTSYPVVYLLDGYGHFHSVTGMIRQLSTINGNTKVPEMIVVGIPNTNRGRDLTPTQVDIDFFTGDSLPFASGGGDKFLDFVEKELIPHVEENYPTAPYRTFIGHSLGGLSVLDALKTRPDVFNNYIAIDPSLSWDQGNYLKSLDSVLTHSQYKDKNLYVGVANTIGNNMNYESVQKDTARASFHIRSIINFVNSMENKEDNGLNVASKYYEDDTHGSAPLITTYDALRFIFPWYDMNFLDDFYDPDMKKPADELITLIKDHYKKVSAHLGYEVLPSERFVNELGYSFMNDKVDYSHALMELNVQNYPNSSNVYDSMGDCYLVEKDSVRALEYFNKGAELDNPFSKDKAEMLREKLGKN